MTPTSHVVPKTGFRFSVFGIRLDGIRFNHVVPILKDLIERNRSAYVCIINVHVLVTAVRDRRFEPVVNGSDCNFTDGMPLVWYARKRFGMKYVQRVAGPSLMVRCLDSMRGCRHFFYGASEETLDRIERMAIKKFPGINIAGRYAPPFRTLTPREEQDIATVINRASPDIIWVALGAPKQEVWMKDFKNRLDRGVMIGVGAAFDYFACTSKRAPVWLRRVGLEWLCRLLYEPRRLLKRYLVTNSLFVFYLLRENLVSALSKEKGK